MTIGGIWDYYTKKVGYGELPASKLQGTAVSHDIPGDMHRQRAVCKKEWLKRINPFGTDVDNDAIDKAWLSRLVRKVAKYLTLGFVPIVVFDGKKSKLKMDNAGVKRGKPVASAEEQLAALREKHAGRDPLLIPAADQALARTLLERVDRMPSKSVQKCKSLFQELGIPWVQSKGEAERTCSLMNKQGLTSAVLSVDGDCLAFGAQLILREEKDVYDSEGFGSVGFETAEIEPMLDAVGMDFPLFQQLCIMAGTDFNSNLKGIGFNKAIPLLRQHKSITRLSRVMDTSVLNYSEVKKEFEIVDWKETAESWCLMLGDDDERDAEVLGRYGLQVLADQLANGKSRAMELCGEWLVEHETDRQVSVEIAIEPEIQAVLEAAIDTEIGKLLLELPGLEGIVSGPRVEAPPEPPVSTVTALRTRAVRVRPRPAPITETEAKSEASQQASTDAS